MIPGRGDGGKASSAPERGSFEMRAPLIPASLPPLPALIVAIAILYFARDVFMPLALALLLTFALAPIVALIRKTRMPRVAAVICAVAAAFVAISILSFVVVTQVAELAQQLPTYQSNILSKIRSLKESGAESGIINRLSEAVERVGKEIERGSSTSLAAPEDGTTTPLLVQIYSPERPIQILTSMIAPLIGPLATAGLVIVVVIFMLLEREDLRDRFIRLVGYSDLHRTTEALQDAGSRVGQYLLMQLVVNVTYGIPVAMGLWLIGIPNAILWGALAIILRFVPYIGPILSMVLPLFLAIAVSPDWSLVLWVAALFLTMELISNNVIEPWLYGSRTGLSPLAIIVAAIFWTWLWGPAGLVMSTPLTVCLVVLGKHVPQFQFFEVLFGSEPVLDPAARLYQRLLANDPDEATDQVEELLAEDSLVDVFGEVTIPALIMAENDRARGVLTDEQQRHVSLAALALVANLRDTISERSADEDPKPPLADEAPSEPRERPALPDGGGRSVLCIGGRGDLDDASAAMLAQALEMQGAAAASASFAGLRTGEVEGLDPERVDTVVLCFLNRNSVRQGRFVLRRLRAARPGLRVGIVFWTGNPGQGPQDQRPDRAAELHADFVAYDIAGATAAALADPEPVPERRLAREA